MGQEDEETAEMIATIKSEHVAMKSWYNNPGNRSTDEDLKELHSKNGAYPDFWRDVISKWTGPWKQARKCYLRHLARVESKSDSNEEKKESSKSVTDENKIPRKRRSRWASNAPSDANQNEEKDLNKSTDTTGNTQRTTKRRSRWARTEPGSNTNTVSDPNKKSDTVTAPATLSNVSPGTTNKTLRPTAATGILGLLPGMPAGMTQEQLTQLSTLQNRLRAVNEKLATLDIEAIRVDALPRGHPDRSPSPPPIYGVDGVRKNTRAVRWRERYTSERQDCLEKIMDLNPALRPPGFVKRKRSKKVYVPVHEHPTYNFIGLIIGPRGKTQKEMENKSGCKIAIRGKGSVKEGARGRRDGKPMEGDNEPLHVVITGEDQASVDKAAEMIEKMLVVIDDEKNVHKQQQLRELALLNGTLKDEEFCHICAEKGHRTFECPKRFTMNKPLNTVKCAICGDTSHPTRDCTMKKNETQQDEKQLDSDYQNFMDELDGKAPDAKNTQTAANPTNPNGGLATIAATGTSNTLTQPLAGTCIPATTKLATVPPGQPPSMMTNLPLPSSVQSNAAYTQPPPMYSNIPPPMSVLTQNNTINPNTSSIQVNNGLQVGQVNQTVASTMIATQGIPPPPLPLPPVDTNQNVGQALYNQTQYYGGQATNYGYNPGYPAQSYDQSAVVAQQNVVSSGQQLQAQSQNQGYDDMTSGWDYQSYYGTGNTGGDAGAGGFNWWDAS